ncbi:MAG: hypothetical protein RI963_3287 [Planctomycetota bacterium]
MEINHQNRPRTLIHLAFVASLAWMATGDVQAQPGPGRGQGFRGGMGPGGPGFGGPGFGGPGRGRGMQGKGPGGEQHDERHDADRDVFHFLLTNHEKIKRTVKELPNGVETLTESDDPEIAAKIIEHVEWMTVRIKETKPIRMRDPLFAEIFKHTDKIKMAHEDTEKGVRVTETSDDPAVAKLIQAHAKVVTAFVEKGFDEAMKNHPVPEIDGLKQAPEASPAPVIPIPNHGSVVRLPDAAHQPRTGTKVLIDVTRGSEPGELNAAIEKIAKYINIYAGGGAEPAHGDFAVVFHGDATLAVLNDAAYAERLKTQRNPNLDLLRQLHQQGVELFVCGQTLNSKGVKPKEVAVFVDTAVSAFTVVVNLQTDGYTYVPLGK